MSTRKIVVDIFIERRRVLVMRVKCPSGVMGWVRRLRSNYASFEEFFFLFRAFWLAHSSWVRYCSRSMGCKSQSPWVSQSIGLRKSGVSMNKAQLLERLRTIENQLSPENLCCDGEASPSWVRKEWARLRKARAKVIKALGYEPTIQEIYPELAIRR